MKKYIGIDIGGTSIKGIIINEKGDIICEDSEKNSMSADISITGLIALLITRMFKAGNVTLSEVKGIGIGCPGIIDSVNGVVVFAGNLKLKNYYLANELSRIVSLPVKIINDANAAAFGEAKFGAGKNYQDSVLITLGTGVGGGITINGKLFEGGKSAGAEIGHTVIVEDGYPCTCGRKGCFEAYSSATALIRKTKEVMQENKDSAMWKSYNLDTVSGKTAFDYAKSDKAAKSVVDWYVKYLACGITNIANVFRPQVIMIGGGVSEQGETLLAPVREAVNSQLFGGTAFAPVKIVKATLGNKAGAFGAAALFI